MDCTVELAWFLAQPWPPNVLAIIRWVMLTLEGALIRYLAECELTSAPLSSAVRPELHSESSRPVGRVA
jgi:hypothetical protein